MIIMRNHGTAARVKVNIFNENTQFFFACFFGTIDQYLICNSS